MADDEMGAWLHHYTEELYSELLGQYQTAIPPPQQPPPQQLLYNMVAPPQHPPSTVAPPQRPPLPSTPSLNFLMFSRMTGKGSEATPNSTAVAKSGGEASSAFVGSLGRDSVFERGEGSGEMTVSPSFGTSVDPITSTCTTTTVLTYTTSEEGGDQMAEAEAEAMEDRKRKRKQKQPQIDHSTTTATSVMYYQDVELDAANYNTKDSWGLLRPTKRTRAAEVHNLSERKRRDKINEKMKALQELVPQCNKSDKASMLDEVIEYLKSLQMQLQMMSLGCGMVPMYPGMQQPFMPPIMGMGMDHPMIPFSSNTPGFNFRNTLAIGTGPQNAPNINIRPVRMPSVASASSMSVNQGDYVPVQNPNLADSYQQYMALQQMQMRMRMQVVQDQSISRPGSSNNEDQPMPSTSKSEGEDDQ